MTGRRAIPRVDTGETAHSAQRWAAPKGAAKRRDNGNQPDLGALKGHLGYFLRRVQVWIFQDFIRTLAGMDIRPAQYSVLTVIGANPGLSQADVAGLLGIERARLARLLHRLEKRGLTQRLASPVDRRSHSLKLSAAGRTVLKRAEALAAIHEARLMQHLGPMHHKALLDVLRGFDLSH